MNIEVIHSCNLSKQLPRNPAKLQYYETKRYADVWEYRYLRRPIVKS